MRVETAVAIALACVALPAPAAEGPAFEVGGAAPKLELIATDGMTRSLASGDGPKVLIFYRGLW